MNENNKGWYNAIYKRHSRRTFADTPIEKEKLESLHEFIIELNRSTDLCRIVLVRSHDGSIFSGIRGGYGVIRGAPAYLAFITHPDTADSYARLGYNGEVAILEATRLDLGTCWVSGTFNPKVAAKNLDISVHEKLIAVSPLGNPQGSYSFTEKVMSGFASSRKRKPLEQICTGEPFERWPDWAKTAAEAGRIAPSAMNRQPWIFRFGNQQLSVEITGSGNSGAYSKRLDCGIALRHLVVGAQHAIGHAVSVEFLVEPQVGIISDVSLF